MKKKYKKIQGPIIKQKKEIGRRFKEFRTLIGKTQFQFAEELNVYQSSVTNIEVGRTFPSIMYIIYFCHHYNLNPTWLLCGEGVEFLHEREFMKKPWVKSPLPCHIKENDPMYEDYIELSDLMRIPIIEKVIFGKLTELKLLAKDEIESFKKPDDKD